MKVHVFEVMWSPSLTQKRKKWYDGTAKYYEFSRKLVLKDDESNIVGEDFLTSSQPPHEGAILSLDRYIVELTELKRVAELDDAFHRPHSSRARSCNVQAVEGGGGGLRKKQKKKLVINPITQGPTLSDVLKRNPYKYQPPRPLVAGGRHSARHLSAMHLSAMHLLTPELPERQIDLKTGTSTVTVSPQPNHGRPVQPRENFTEPGNDRECVYNQQTYSPERSECTQFEEEPPRKPEMQSLEPLSPELEDLSSDESSLESSSDVAVVDVREAKERAWLDTMPVEVPSSGPWSREAYLLFKFRPPRRAIKQEFP